MNRRTFLGAAIGAALSFAMPWTKKSEAATLPAKGAEYPHRIVKITGVCSGGGKYHGETLDGTYCLAVSVSGDPLKKNSHVVTMATAWKTPSGAPVDFVV
jgi:hypothetical protein